MKNEALVLLAASLLRIPGRRLRALARGDQSALRAWIAGESALRLAEARRDARLAFERLESLGARLVSLNDPEYPPGLLDLRDPPTFLTVLGTLANGGTAIVGAREPTEEARSFVHALGGALAAPIVSGLAFGIDAAAHGGALDASVATIAYVGNGLGATYPPEHRELEERIIAAGGAIVSERLPDERATRWSLTKRDRLQAAHASALILVQSEAAGGAMHAVRSARELGRPHFALEPRDDSGFSGNARAIAEGAVALPWDVDEICRRLSPAPETRRA